MQERDRLTAAARLERLVTLIRNGTSLSELKKEVGPSDVEAQESEKRLARLDQLYKRYGYAENMPPSVAKTYADLQAQQDSFEATYY